MDYQTLVSEEKEAGLRLVQFIQRTHPVKVAFWLKQEVESPWKLYIGGEWVDFSIQGKLIKTAPPNIARSNRVNLTQAALVVNFWLPWLQIDIVAASEFHLRLFMPTNNRPNCPSSFQGHASDIRLATTARILSDADARSTFQPAILC
jgi:hypothetical protein